MTMPAFMFSTGIENSAPTIKGGRVRVDEMEKCGHYDQWPRDFDLVQELGLTFLRYGPPLHRTYLAPGRYDWSFADLTFDDLRRRDIIPITDLCHFGVPDWIENFQNPDFPELFAANAGNFAIISYGCINPPIRSGWRNESIVKWSSFSSFLEYAPGMC